MISKEDIDRLKYFIKCPTKRCINAGNNCTQKGICIMSRLNKRLHKGFCEGGNSDRLLRSKYAKLILDMHGIKYEDQ
jgi:hypothetical protein